MVQGYLTSMYVHSRIFLTVRTLCTYAISRVLRNLFVNKLSIHCTLHGSVVLRTVSLTCRECVIEIQAASAHYKKPPTLLTTGALCARANGLAGFAHNTIEAVIQSMWACSCTSLSLSSRATKPDIFATSFKDPVTEKLGCASTSPTSRLCALAY